MVNSWRMIGPDDFSGAMNMAVDAAFVEEIKERGGENIIRFYRWSPPCITLGRFQKIDGINIDACKKRGIDIAKRPTGGRAIFHNNEITFSIIMRADDLGESTTNIMQSYRILGYSLTKALKKLGLDAELVDHNHNDRVMSTIDNPACFAAKARCDIMVNNKKIIGSAQSRKAGIILQQNSLPISVDYSLWDELFYGSNAEFVKDSGATELKAEMDKAVDYMEFMNNVNAAFTEDLGILFKKAEIGKDILQRAYDIADDYKVTG